MIIINADDVMRSQGHKSMAAWMISLLQAQPGGERILSLCRAMLLAPPGREAVEPVAHARVDAGRWIVNCPFCPAAYFAHPVERRSWCINCQNRGAGGRWVCVAWPDNWRAIESVLVVRPAPENRQWRPGDSVADLVALNVARGLPEAARG